MNKINRVHWVDNTKAILIVVVYYTHLLEEYIYPWNKDSFDFKQYKFINSFIVPLFFFMAGFFWKKKAPAIAQEIKRLFMQRIGPVILFSLLLLPVWFMWAQNDEAGLLLLKKNIVSYVWWHPRLNWPTWFLVCLFLVELIALCVLPRLSSKLSIYVAAFIFIFTGVYVCNHAYYFTKLTGMPSNAWYILEVIVPFGFYALGYASFQNLLFLTRINVVMRAALACIFLTLTIITCNLNTPQKAFIVSITDPSYGKSLLFIFTSLMGIFSVITTASLLPSSPAIQFIGQNTLVLLGVNGIFYHFINTWLVTIFRASDTILSVTVNCFMATSLSFAISLLLIIIIQQIYALAAKNVRSIF